MDNLTYATCSGFSTDLRSLLKVVNFSLVKHYNMDPNYIWNLKFFEYQYLLQDIEEWRKEEERRQEEQRRKEETERKRQESKYKMNSKFK